MTASQTAPEKTTKDIRLKPSTLPSDDKKKESTSVKRAAPVPKAAQDVYIEPFYFPAGKPPSLSESDITVQRIRDTFSKLAGGKAGLAHMKSVVKVGDCQSCIISLMEWMYRIRGQYIKPVNVSNFILLLDCQSNVLEFQLAFLNVTQNCFYFFYAAIFGEYNLYAEYKKCHRI